MDINARLAAARHALQKRGGALSALCKRGYALKGSALPGVKLGKRLSLADKYLGAAVHLAPVQLHGLRFFQGEERCALRAGKSQELT